MDLELNGRLALVTGSTAGIGFAIARELAREGARVIVNGRTGARVQSAADAIRRDLPGAQLELFTGDLSTSEAASAITARYPDVEILVNNLGIYAVRPFEDITDAEWISIIETNFMSGVRLSRFYLPRMKAAGWGRILFISSESAVNIPTEMIHYGVTKTMQVALARGLAETTAGTGVTVNSVLVGPTRSEGVEEFVAQMAASRGVDVSEVEKDFFRTARPTSILQRFESPDEIAHMTTYLASPLASGTNGAAVRVEGGLLRSIL